MEFAMNFGTVQTAEDQTDRIPVYARFKNQQCSKELTITDTLLHHNNISHNSIGMWNNFEEWFKLPFVHAVFNW